MASIQLKNIRRDFGEVKVIRDVDIAINDKEFVVFVGPSGCGKSTLLRMVAGLDQPTSGDIVIGGKVVNALPPRERDVAMVFQNYALYPHMTVDQNMGFGLMISKVEPQTIRTKVAEAARILGLDKLLDRYPRQLSGGQRQRVAMGRAMARDPAVFLFDEPLSNLDAKLRVQMRTEIRALHQRLGATSIYVTHDQIEAMTMADRIVVLRDGIVEQTGTPPELYDRPVNTFVATFIGSPAMNLMPGQRSANGVSLAGSGSLDAVPAAVPAECIVGVRPEHLEIVPSGTPGAWPVTLEVVEFAGADTMLSCRLGEQQLLATVHSRVNARPADQVALRPRDGCVHWFDAASGKRAA
ncbi:ABC transporter ATP-binding protein [Polaromonas jejuensis]|uniref:ABC transporter ATP-binding protein n=1 Tax=Polaromonas jejuensis TaxID=457502 RepID=A0ABW0QC30_9BURK|nr:sn-glycerol-3-phosphate ABC transporter ATP-binding protein UgpC [Polaromonas jejuensis]